MNYCDAAYDNVGSVSAFVAFCCYTPGSLRSALNAGCYLACFPAVFLKASSVEFAL
uniref:Uncharacterized protein n=1 Tax=Anguilla anguilla TaxID=7936 RepID=A0A0E9UR46_ANGAN